MFDHEARIRAELDMQPAPAMTDAPEELWINWSDADRENPPTAVVACVRPGLVHRLHSPTRYILATPEALAEAPEVQALIRAGKE